jgi:exodeoxyribonuclease X
MQPLELTIFDTETASLKGGVCDIAIVIVDENLEVVWEAESLVDPEVPISPDAMGIHHITNEMVIDQPTLAEFMHMYGYPFKRPNQVFVGHNISFDTRICAAHMPETFRSLCTLKLARNLWPEAESHKLQTLRYMLNLDGGTAHRAMGDVRVCLSLLRKVAQEKGIGIAGLIELARKPISLDNKMPFGKHRGEKLKDVPVSYVKWLLSTPDVDPDLREAFQIRLAKQAA